MAASENVFGGFHAMIRQPRLRAPAPGSRLQATGYGLWATGRVTEATRWFLTEA